MKNGFYIILLSLLFGMFFLLANSEKNIEKVNMMDKINSWKLVK